MLRQAVRPRFARSTSFRTFGAITGGGENFASLVGSSRSKTKTKNRLVSMNFAGGGPLAHLADGSGVCSSGGTVVHAAVTTAVNHDATNDFLPLTVDYRSRAYAFGRIPSVFTRRERHGSDDEVLVSRIIDRAVRPLFPKGLVNQVQVIATVHAGDRIHDPTIMSVNAASLALMRSSVEWHGPIGCVRIGMVKGKLQINPTVEQMHNSSLDFVYAGTQDRALMLECVGDEVPEATVAAALKLAQQGARAIIDEQLEVLKHEEPRPPLAGESEVGDDDMSAVLSKAESGLYTVPAEMQADLDSYGLADSIDMFSSCAGLSRKDRGLQENSIQKKLQAFLAEHSLWAGHPHISRNMAVDNCMKKAFRCTVLGRDSRVDGREFDEVRPITATADVLPSVHGSSFFGRGDTHVLSTVTLGPLQDAKVSVSLDGSSSDSTASFARQKALEEGSNVSPISSRLGERRSSFFLHYDFPPYCTGVVGNATATNRRMVGHGNLAERALRSVIPDVTRFPYTVRAYAECTSSSGSSSMASCCSATLAMLDAGVPLKNSVAGVSVGLVTAREGDDISSATESNSRGSTSSLSSTKYRLLTDILGTEDHYGDMDFKIAGTNKGVTAMQLDMKLPDGVELAILEEALKAAGVARRYILQKMRETLSASRDSVKDSAPSAEMVSYDAERKRLLIGPGGEMVRYIEDIYNCSIDTTEDGLAYIYGSDRASVSQATALVKDIVTVLEPGDELTGEVTEIKDFGAFVKLTRSQEAMLHLSEISHDSAVIKRPIATTLAVGQKVQVQVLSVDRGTGAVRVSRKALLKKGETDNISADNTSEIEQVEPGGLRDPLPTFPVIPPRKWSKDFFRNKVASEDDIKNTMPRVGNGKHFQSGSESDTITDIASAVGEKRRGHPRISSQNRDTHGKKGEGSSVRSNYSSKRNNKNRDREDKGRNGGRDSKRSSLTRKEHATSPLKSPRGGKVKGTSMEGGIFSSLLTLVGLGKDPAPPPSVVSSASVAPNNNSSEKPVRLRPHMRGTSKPRNNGNGKHTRERKAKEVAP